MSFLIYKNLFKNFITLTICDENWRWVKYMKKIFDVLLFVSFEKFQKKCEKFNTLYNANIL